jgi:hypothetical protein
MTVLNLHAYPVKVSHTIHQGLYNSEHLRFVMPLIPTARAVVLSPDSKFGISLYEVHLSLLSLSLAFRY